MPGLISVSDFVHETSEDFNSPTTSNFVSRISQCRETVSKCDEALSGDKECLVKFKNAIKDLNKTGLNHVNCEQELSKALNKLGELALIRDDESDDVGTAFQKFSVVTKELSTLMNNLMKNLETMVLNPTDRLLKTELRGSKGDIKRPFDRAWKEYQDKYSELERHKKKAAKEVGLYRSDLTPGEIADEMDKERKYLQLTMTEYLLRVNEVKTKKGALLLQQLLEFYRAQYNYFSEGLQTIEHFGNYIEDLTYKLHLIKQQQQEEKSHLLDLRNLLKSSPGFSKVNQQVIQSSTTTSTVQQKSSTQNNSNNYAPYTLHQAKGDASLGNKKSGYLSKRSEGRLRNIWQKRRCVVMEGFLDIYHADESKTPTRVNLLTCQMKPVAEDRLNFDVVSYNRTYHFQAETELEKDEWMSVLLNSKDGALNQAFEDNGKSTSANQGFIELQRTLVNTIRGLPGNDKCCDCGSNNDATWISTNFGIIVCIECSGIHREMGVHISKIQSLTLDNIGTSQLLVARVMSNELFNKVMEARVLKQKLHPSSTMDERKAYIKSKYVDKKFVQPFCSNAGELLNELETAIDSQSIYDLLQVIGEAHLHGVDITDPLTSSEFAETSLHYAISHETGQSLHVVDFLVQNSTSLDRQTREGNTPLHYCVIQNQTESMRLLLRSGANPSIENNNGKTPLSIAKERSHKLCEELLQHALHRKKTMFENVNIDWHLALDDGSTDFSDDETLDEHSSRTGTNVGIRTPERNSAFSPNEKSGGRLRPLSVYTPNHVHNINNNSMTSSSISPLNKGGDWMQHSDWSRGTPSTDSGDSPGSDRVMPPPPPPPSTKKPIVSSSNLATSMVGSLKKGTKKHTSPSYNTLPSNRYIRSSPKVISNSPAYHKRSPSSDSGNGTLHNPLSRSNTPVSYLSSGGKVHTVFLQVGPKSEGGASSDNSASPPLQSFTEESSPENNRLSPTILHHSRMTQSTESLDSMSDESGGGGRGIGGRSSNVVSHRLRNLHYDFANLRKCRALYDCEADNEDELTFEEGDLVAIINEETEDENWMEGVLITDPTKRGLFPVSFVHMLD
ncbi:arfGAP with SH3 domain, ANK repeat and PH domain-containing protein isoform X2 [Lepeophtheirus salmonis]|uniref:arfGAP with SH3 domain, ANK repeat and PH domain-containing protein isoform X2 n=1 Tax=Lepeophtheirus salmonis TaxID=72036 RepID=UPI001AE8DE00|nr:arf-GAP with SH3 domain, ANK repeat and PH domain-containing protein 1-like isoform X2 [Lepeophtheirus salmonis]